jgi:general secretion pathway protein C
MKRWPILVNFILFAGLCASGTFWAMQLFKPAVRPVVAPKQHIAAVNAEAAVALFGGRMAAVAAPSNFQLKGVVAADNALESVAILATDGKPAEAVRVNSEAKPGVTVKEVHAQYVLLSDGGIIRRVELPVSAPQTQTQSALLGLQPDRGAQFLSPQNVAAPEGAQQPPPPPPNSPAGHRLNNKSGTEQ